MDDAVGDRLASVPVIARISDLLNTVAFDHTHPLFTRHHTHTHPSNNKYDFRMKHMCYNLPFCKYNSARMMFLTVLQLAVFQDWVEGTLRLIATHTPLHH